MNGFIEDSDPSANGSFFDQKQRKIEAFVYPSMLINCFPDESGLAVALENPAADTTLNGNNRSVCKLQRVIFGNIKFGVVAALQQDVLSGLAISEILKKMGKIPI